MQASKDQVQWRDAMSSLWEPQFGMPLCSELLQQLVQGKRVCLTILSRGGDYLMVDKGFPCHERTDTVITRTSG
jgi:hypothetical protein